MWRWNSDGRPALPRPPVPTGAFRAPPPVPVAPAGSLLNASDIQRRREERYALARSLLGRCDRRRASIGLQVAGLVAANVGLLVALVILLYVVVGSESIGGLVGVVVRFWLAGNGLFILASVVAAIWAMRDFARARPAVSGQASEALFFDLDETAENFESAAQFDAAFRSALNEEMIRRASAALWRATRGVHRQRRALRWASQILLLALAVTIGSVVLVLLCA